MSRRPHVSPDDSLELLLDTICNTFATVIFISMLASILAQNSAPKTADAAEISGAISSVEDLQLRASDLAGEREKLEQEISQQSAILERFASEESLQLAVALQQSLAEYAEIIRNKESVAADMLAGEKQQLQAEKSLAEQLEQLREQRARNSQAQTALQELKTRAGREAIIRQVHETDKFPLAFALDNGRLYTVHLADSDASGPVDVTLNRNECLITETGGQTVIRMNQSAGLQIHGNASASEQARIRFRGVPRAFVVQLFVARDSFTDFLPVREALTGLNLEYSLQVMPGEDVELFLSDQVRTRTYVQ
ncbi:MAG: hypothetical protein RL215_2789 [Planctomycetota bacterium]